MRPKRAASAWKKMKIQRSESASLRAAHRSPKLLQYLLTNQTIISRPRLRVLHATADAICVAGHPAIGRWVNIVAHVAITLRIRGVGHVHLFTLSALVRLAGDARHAMLRRTLGAPNNATQSHDTE